MDRLTLRKSIREELGKHMCINQNLLTPDEDRALVKGLAEVIEAPPTLQERISQAEEQVRELRQDQDTLIDAQKDALGDEVLKAVVDRIVGFVPEDIARGIAALKAENAQLICDRVPRQQYEGLSDENVRLKDENKATLDAITQVCSASQINVITGLVIAARTGGRA